MNGITSVISRRLSLCKPVESTLVHYIHSPEDVRHDSDSDTRLPPPYIQASAEPVNQPSVGDEQVPDELLTGVT